MMRDLHERYPLYGFDRHKGYNTDEHERALTEYGPCPVHRYSFVNVNRAAVHGPVPIEPGDPADALDLLDPAAAMAPVTAGAVGFAASLRGASGENERRMTS
jgi:ribonuclease HII